MEMRQISALGEFLEAKERRIVELAQKATEKIVKTELALFDFEMLLAANIAKEESERLTEESRKLRRETWNELSEKFNGSTDKIQAFANNF